MILASLILDLQRAGGSSPAIVSPGTVLSLTVRATLTGATSGSLQSVYYGIDNSAALGTLSVVTATSPFTTLSQPGTPSGGSVGLGDVNTSPNWVFARAPALTTGLQFPIGTLTYTAGSTYGTTTLAVVPRASNGVNVPALWLADGQLLFDPASPGTSLSITVAHAGDANLDGKITADDYALLDRGLSRHLTGWSNGDFNADGIINNQDYLLIDHSLSQAQGFSPGFLSDRESQFGAQYVSSLLASLPEPSPLLACGFAIPTLLRRRKVRKT